MQNQTHRPILRAVKHKSLITEVSESKISQQSTCNNESIDLSKRAHNNSVGQGFEFFGQDGSNKLDNNQINKRTLLQMGGRTIEENKQNL